MSTACDIGKHCKWECSLIYRTKAGKGEYEVKQVPEKHSWPEGTTHTWALNGSHRPATSLHEAIRKAELHYLDFWGD